LHQLLHSWNSSKATPTHRRSLRTCAHSSSLPFEPPNRHRLQFTLIFRTSPAGTFHECAVLDRTQKVACPFWVRSVLPFIAIDRAILNTHTPAEWLVCSGRTSSHWPFHCHRQTNPYHTHTHTHTHTPAGWLVRSGRTSLHWPSLGPLLLACWRQRHICKQGAQPVLCDQSCVPVLCKIEKYCVTSLVYQSCVR